MSAIITALLALVAQIAPITGEAGVIAGMIGTLEQLISLAAKEYQTVIPAIKNIIAALSVNPATTQDQIATLKVLDAKCDQAFEAAATDAEAEDAAADQSGPATG